MVEPTRTDRYLVVWAEGPHRHHPWAVSRAAIATTVMLAILAATAGVLLALTQHGASGVAWAWAAWVLAFAYLVGRLITDSLRGPVR